MRCTHDTRRALACVLAGALLVPAGCGSSPEFNKATQYTAESLAQELAFRYNALAPSGKTARKARRPQKGAVDSKADEKSATKSQSKAAAKKEPPKTVDDVLDDITNKAGQVQGMSRSEVYRKMSELISKDKSLPQPDQKALAEKLNEMSGG